MAEYPILNLIQAISNDDEIELLSVNTGVNTSKQCVFRVKYYYQVIEVALQEGDNYSSFKARAKKLVLDVIQKKFDSNQQD